MLLYVAVPVARSPSTTPCPGNAGTMDSYSSTADRIGNSLVLELGVWRHDER